MIIFLDIDGVMVPAKSWAPLVLLEDDFPAFSPKATSVLNSLLHPAGLKSHENVKVVLTTSHKNRFTIEEWKSIFRKRHISIEHLEVLITQAIGKNRKEEICIWFQEQAIADRFVILDDDTSLNDLPDHLKAHLVLTSSTIGLNQSHIGQIESIIQDKLIAA
jgi:hypothetical protein